MFLRLLRNRLVSKVTTVPRFLPYVDTFHPSVLTVRDNRPSPLSCPTKATCPTAKERRPNYISRNTYKFLNRRYVLQGRDRFLNETISPRIPSLVRSLKGERWHKAKAHGIKYRDEDSETEYETQKQAMTASQYIVTQENTILVNYNMFY
jgi:hypothetical protein